MNKIIRHLIKEMIEDLNLKESNNKDPKYLSVKKVSGPNNRFNDPASSSRVDSLQGAFLEKDYDPNEIQLSIDDEYDRYSSLFQQISNDPKKFNIGTNIVININELDFDLENKKTIKLSRRAVKKQISGNAFLKVFGSFNKDEVANPSIFNVQRSKSEQDRFLTDDSAAPADEIKASDEYKSIVDEVDSGFHNKSPTLSYYFTAKTSVAQVPDNPHDRMETLLNSTTTPYFADSLRRLIDSTYVDGNNNIFFKTVDFLNNYANSRGLPRPEKFNMEIFKDNAEYSIIYEEVRNAILNSLKSRELVDKYGDFFGNIKDRRKIFSPIAMLQQSKKAKLSTSDAMLPFAHAAKDKVTTDVNVEVDFDEKIIKLNVDQFSNILVDFKPEVVIIPGSSSTFNTKYYNEIERLLSQRGIPIKSYSTYKSTHIISFDEDEARRDTISQQTRGGYVEGFWNADSAGKLKHFISAIHQGGNKDSVKNYTKMIGNTGVQLKTVTVVETLIKNTGKQLKTFLKDSVILSGQVKNGGVALAKIPGLKITQKNLKSRVVINISIDDDDKFIDINSTYFSSNQDLETSRIALINEIQAEVDYFEKNGVTNTSSRLLTQISGEDGPGSAYYTSSVKSLREERLKRMLELQLKSKYTIDKKEKKAKTLSEMGVVKISEIGSLGTMNQSKRVFLKDMHEVLDDAKLPKALRPLVLDYLNTFASIVYDQMIGNVINKSKVVSNITETMREKILEHTKGKSVDEQTPLFDIILGVGSVDSFSLLNPSFDQIRLDFDNAYNALSSNQQQELSPLYDFIVTNFFQSIKGLKSAVSSSNNGFEEFVEIYKNQIFNLITARGSDFSSGIIDDMSDLNSALMSQLQEKVSSDQDIPFVIGDQENSVANEFRESVKSEYDSIYKIAAERVKESGIDQFSDINEVLGAFLNEDDNSKDLVASAVYNSIIQKIKTTSGNEDLLEALEQFFELGDSDDLEALIELSDDDDTIKAILNDASAAASSFLEEIENKEIETFNSQDYKHKQIMASMDSDGFVVKSVAVILNSFVEQAFNDYLIDSKGNTAFSEDLANLIQNNPSFKNSINSSLRANCVHETYVQDEEDNQVKLSIVPKIDIINGFLIFSANSLQATVGNFSFKINFDFIKFLEREENYQKLKELAEEISKDFIEKGIGFNRPKNIILLDDNVSSGGTFGLIAKNILKMQSDNNCYFSFENVSTPLTSFSGDLKSFDFKDVTSVENSTNKVLSHIIGLTPIFI